ncbi:MAG: hypothetical protein ACREFQ_13110, partial [Stellaceae bacterium]
MKAIGATKAGDAHSLLRRARAAVAAVARGNVSTYRRIASVVLALLLWELTARLIDNPLFFVSLSGVARRGIELWQAGALQVHIETSLE